MRVRPTIVLLILATAAACGDGDATVEPTTSELEARLAAAQERVLGCARLPWLSPIQGVRGQLSNLASRMQNHAYRHGDATPAQARESMETLLGRFQELEPLVAVIEHATPLAGRIWAAEQGILTLLARMKVPDDAPFPLRARFQTGWMSDRSTHVGYLASGLESLLRGRQDDKLKIGVGNLERLAREGEELLEQVNRLSRQVDMMQVKVFGLPRRIEWGRTVVRTAEQKGGIDQAAMDAIAAAADAAERALPEIVSAWDLLKLELVKHPESARDELGELMAKADLHLIAVSKAGHQPAIKLRILGPHH